MLTSNDSANTPHKRHDSVCLGWKQVNQSPKRTSRILTLMCRILDQLADHGLDAVNAGVAEFHYFMAFGANDVVVLAVAIALLVLGEVAAKLMLTDKALLY